MCLNKHYILNKRGRSILVDCGHCPACLQAKSVVRTNRIRSNTYDVVPEGRKQKVCYFVTLTYRNECCPYFNVSDFTLGQDYHNISSPLYEECVGYDRRITHNISARPANILPSDTKTFRNIPVYRDCSTTWIRRTNAKDGSYRVRRHNKRETVMLAEYSVPSDLRYCMMPTLKNYHSGKCGIIYYPDVQQFIKNLRHVLQRTFHFYDKFDFFCCAEYGPSTCRPHFHLLLFTEGNYYATFKAACCKAWSYDDFYRTAKNFEYARNAASYVSSYVNCDTSLPLLFREFKPWRQHHSFSKGFGLALQEFSLPKILEKISSRDLRIYRTILRKNSVSDVSFLLPKYVINRFWPKFKGYYRLTTDEIYNILLNPSNLYYYAPRLELTKGQLDSLITSLITKQKLFVSYGYPKIDYALFGSRVWTVYASNILEDFYNSQQSITQIFTAYDNIIHIYDTSIRNDSLEDLLPFLPSSFTYETDPNLFPENQFKHFTMLSAYHSYSKDKKVRNICYSQNNHF